MELPEGAVVFLFTDIEGSTRRWEADPDDMVRALDIHREMVDAAVGGHGGVVVKDTGDGIFAAFASPDAAVEAAVVLQRWLVHGDWYGVEPLAVRMGLHAGEAMPSGNDYFGPAVNRCARIMAAAAGRQILVSGALRRLVEDGHEFADLGVHRLKDLTEPVELHQVLHPDLPAEFPPPRSLDAARTNLPAVTSTFVGRHADVTALRNLLAQRRIVTVLGTGGVGKTTLALHTAGEVADDFPDGVWFVELAGLTEPDLVAPAVAAAARLADEPGRSWLDTVATRLGGTRALVVLDNCEHVVDAAAAVAEAIVRGGTGARVLATSREALRIGGEAVHRLGSLPGPPDENPWAVEAAPATRLFLERAADAGAQLELTAENRSAIQEICRRLDGVPLAIELAAARVVSLPPVELAARLEDRFSVLNGHRRGTRGRHRTLEAAVAWSYDLLSPSEQALFDRLSCFAGTFGLEAAESVAAHVTGDIAGGIASLVEQSLLEAVPGPVARYRMLETLRSFGRARCDQKRTWGPAQRALVGWAATFSADARAGLDGPEQATWLSRVVDDLDNLRQAMEWSVEHDPPAGLAVAANLYRYWFVRNVREGVAWLTRLLSHGPPPPALEAAGLTALGPLLHMTGDYPGSAHRLRRALELHADSEDRRGAAYAHHYLGRALWGEVAPDALRAEFEASLAAMRDIGDPVGSALNLMLLTTWECEYGDVAAAAGWAAELEELTRRIGAPHLVAHGVELAAMPKLLRGDVAGAAHGFAEAVPLYQRIGNRTCAHHCLVNVALLMAHTGRIGLSLRLITATERLQADFGVVVPPYEDLYRGHVLAAADGLDSVERAAERELGLSLDVDDALQLALDAVAGKPVRA